MMSIEQLFQPIGVIINNVYGVQLYLVEILFGSLLWTVPSFPIDELNNFVNNIIF